MSISMSPIPFPPNNIPAAIIKPIFISQVLNGTSLEKPLFEDQHMVLMLNIDPSRPGHALVYSKRPVIKFNELNKAEYASMGKLISAYQKFWRGRPQNVNKTFDFSIFINDGVNAGQSIPHFHVQLIPIASSDPVEKGGIRHFLSLNPLNEKGKPITKAFVLQHLELVYGWVNQQIDELKQFATDHELESHYQRVSKSDEPQKATQKFLQLSA